MSDDEEVKRGGLNGQEDAEKDGAKNSSSDDDDSSSSSSSGSSSDSSSSDSESDGEDNEEKSKENASETPGEGSQAFGQDGMHYSATAAARKHSSDGQSHAHGFSKSALAQATAAEMNVNSNRAAARFREQNPAQAMGMMALGTKKRDRRTIEEIQRDLQLKRGKKPTGSGLSGVNGGLAARSSPPPRGSPVRSPDSGGSGGGDPATVMAQQLGYGGVGGAARNLPKKPVSARDRLEIRLKGRRGNASANTAVGKGRKGVNGVPSTGSAAGTGSGGSMGGMVTNISAGKVVKPMGGDSAFGDTHTELTSSSSGGGNLALTSQAPSAPAKMEPKIEPRVAEVRPDGRVVRALLRGMLRYGDLTDVQMFSRTSSFADEYKQPNFIERSNLQSSTKMTMERLLKLATDIAERAQHAVENKQDSMKFYEVEIKPSQVIERLYENLKLRVAVQRALRDANCPKNGTNGAYVLIAKQCDLPMLGIPRDFPPWSWAEKEHDWTSRKDAALLLGIYVHGFGGWEDILNDDLLHFQQQRALKGERMKKRAENLLKRLPSPDESGEPKFVNAATVLASGPQNPGQSLGAQFSAIIHNNGGNKGNGPVVVASASAASGGGRMQRAAERAAARQQAGVGNSGVIPEDSIRRMHPQLSNGSQSGRYRKSSAASSLNGNDEPEDGEVDNERRERSGSNSRSTSRANSPIDKTSSSAAPRRSSSSTSSKRSASLELEDSGNEVSLKRRKGSEGGSGKHGVQSTASRRRLLSEDECYDKWKPNKKLKDIRQVLKKMKIMTQWSKNQKDQVVVEKVFKYITTIGDAIDKIVRKARVDEGEQNGGRANSDERDADRPTDSHEWDELCSCLWTYAAEYTPFSSRTFEQLYDDICADGEVLRAQRQPTPTR